MGRYAAGPDRATDMPEQRRSRVRSPRPQRRRDERQMVIVDEYRRGRGAQLLVDRGGELDVDVLIRGPVLAAELRTHVHHVAEGPQPLVRESAVVGRECRFVNPQSSQLIGGVVGRNGHLVGCIDDDTVRGPGAVRDPHAAPFTHERVERDGDSAGCR